MDTVAHLKALIQLRGFAAFHQSPSLQMTTEEGGSKALDGRLRRQSTTWKPSFLATYSLSLPDHSPVWKGRYNASFTSMHILPFMDVTDYLLYRLLVSLSFNIHLPHIIQVTLSPPDHIIGSVNFVCTLVLPFYMPCVGSIYGKVGCVRMQWHSL
jgi:hypothetical protein